MILVLMLKYVVYFGKGVWSKARDSLFLPLLPHIFIQLFQAFVE